MAILLPLALLLLFTVSSSGHRPNPAVPCNSNQSIAAEVCKASRDPTTCLTSLSQTCHVPANATVLVAIQSALSLSIQNLRTGRVMVQEILNASATGSKLSIAANNCLMLLRYSKYRMKLTRDALPRLELKDSRAWMSAVLDYQNACCSGLTNVNDTALVDETIAFFNTSLIGISSSILGMIANFDFFGDKTALWAPVKTERDGFWGTLTGTGFFPGYGSLRSGLEVNVTVCKEGGCGFKTVQDAVNSAPDKSCKRFVIWIKTGVYKETVQVPLEKTNVVFLGDGMGKTVITGSMNVVQGTSTYYSATLAVVGDGFMASNLTIQNTAGPDAHQAVAFRSQSDHSIIENCEFLGNQDTLYVLSLRQYYKSCRIQGNVDFIFGNSASFFQDCLILIAPQKLKPEESETNTVTAQSRMDPAQSTGFVFQNCVINGTDEYMGLYHKNHNVYKTYLGRPWKEYSRTVFIGCTMEDLVTPDGWTIWSDDFALKTLYYGEFENKGLGSDTSGRVSWSNQIPADHVSSYSLENFI